MAFRDVRALTEALKALGYPSRISLDGFRSANFELVADILHWLVHRCFPGSAIHGEISTETDRVAFLQSVAQVLAAEGRIALNLKRLYAADGAAVKELLKVVTLVHRASAAATSAAQDDEGQASDSGSWSAAGLAHDAAFLSACVGDLVAHGATLHDALAEEFALKEARESALAVQPEPSHVEACIAEAAAEVADALQVLSVAAGDVSAAEDALHTKLERATGELQRVEKRLATLTGVRPAYMEEFECLQDTLQEVWTAYLQRARNLQYLQAKLAVQQRREQAEADASAKALRKLQRRLADEELRILRGEAAVEDSDLAHGGDQSDSNSDEGARGAAGAAPFSLAATQVHNDAIGVRIAAPPPGPGQVMGSLMADEGEDASIADDDSSGGADVSAGGSEAAMERQTYGTNDDDSNF